MTMTKIGKSSKSLQMNFFCLNDIVSTLIQAMHQREIFLKWFTFFLLSISHFSFAEVKSPYDLITPPITSLSSPQELTSDQVLQDVNLLTEVFSKTFSGRFYFSEMQMNQFIQSLSAIHGKMTTFDFWFAIDDALLTIPDKHTAAIIFSNGHNLMTPHRMSQVRRPQVGKNKISDPSKVWEVSKVGANKDIALIAITKFPSSQNPVWNTFIDSVRKNLQGTKASIIDLRSNSGGDDCFGMEMAKVFWGGPFHHLVEKQSNNTSPEALAIFANHFRLQAIETGQAEDTNSIPEKIVKSFTQQLDQAITGAIPGIQIRPKFGSDKNAIVTQLGYQKPIYILIDALTASSGEFTTLAFSLNPYAKIFGENSAGYIHFGNAGKVLLPNSKIQVAISTQFNQLENNIFIEKVGITPTQSITPGIDAFDTALAALESL